MTETIEVTAADGRRLAIHHNGEPQATARAVASLLEPCAPTPDGWCATHSTAAGPVYCDIREHVEEGA